MVGIWSQQKIITLILQQNPQISKAKEIFMMWSLLWKCVVWCGVVHCNHYNLRNHNMNLYHHEDLRSHFIAAVKLFWEQNSWVLGWLFGGSCLLGCFAVSTGINIVKEIWTFSTAVSTTNANERRGGGGLEADTNYQVPSIPKGTRGPAVVHFFCLSR